MMACLSGSNATFKMALGDQSTFNKYINRDQVLSYVYIASKFISTDVIPASTLCSDDATPCGANI